MYNKCIINIKYAQKVMIHKNYILTQIYDTAVHCWTYTKYGITSLNHIIKYDMKF